MHETAQKSYAEIQSIFEQVLGSVVTDSTVADAFIDRELYQINLATIWTNVVLKPQDAGLETTDLETAHSVFNDHVTSILGLGSSLKDCFSFLNTKAGGHAMQRCRLTQMHKDMLWYFCSMILDPEGHERWMVENSKNQPS